MRQDSRLICGRPFTRAYCSCNENFVNTEDVNRNDRWVNNQA
jgi:hypothetical protein